MFKKLLTTFAMLTGLAFGQVNGGAFGGNPIIFPSGQFVPNASVRICNTPASGFPCSNLATIFTDGTLGVSQVNPIVLTPQSFGQFSFGAAAGNYQVQISGPGLQSYSFPVSFGFPASGTTGSGGIIVLQTSPTINTPTITSPTITGTVGGAATYTSPILASPTITTSFSADGSGYKHIRAASCTTGAGANSTCPTTVTWNTPFVGTTYTVVCQLSSNNVTASVTSETAASRLAASFVVNITNGSGGGATSGTLNCEASHD